MKTQQRTQLLCIGLLVLTLTACYKPAPQPTLRPSIPSPTPLPPDTPDVRAGGSALVGVVTEAVAESFRAWQPHYTIALDASGTSSGFNQMCRGEADLVSAMRPISGDEASACTRNGIDWLEIVIAYDVLAVAANPEDVFLDCLTVDELRVLWSEAEDWAAVREGFPPGQPLKVIAAPLHPSQEQFFAEALHIEALRPDISPADDAAHAAAMVLETPGAVTYLDYGGYRAGVRMGAVRALAVNAGRGCAAPEAESVWSGTYDVLARPMYLYVNAAALRRLSVSMFVSYYLSLDGQARITEAGYLPASPESYERARAAVEAQAGE